MLNMNVNSMLNMNVNSMLNMNEYGRTKSGSTSKQAFYELTKGVMNEFKNICIHPDLVHFVAEFTPKIMFRVDG